MCLIGLGVHERFALQPNDAIYILHSDHCGPVINLCYHLNPTYNMLQLNIIISSTLTFSFKHTEKFIQ